MQNYCFILRTLIGFFVSNIFMMDLFERNLAVKGIAVDNRYSKMFLFPFNNLPSFHSRTQFSIWYRIVKKNWLKKMYVSEFQHVL